MLKGLTNKTLMKTPILALNTAKSPLEVNSYIKTIL
jgi:hypothetical protein